jgi:hypothetical protein
MKKYIKAPVLSIILATNFAFAMPVTELPSTVNLSQEVRTISGLMDAQRLKSLKLES